MQLAKVLDPGFKESLTKLVNAEVPMKTAFKLKSVIRNIDEALKRYDAIRYETLQKYAESKDGKVVSDDNGNAKFVSEESKMEFGKKIAELLQVDIEVTKIKVDELGDNLKLSTNDLLMLEDILVG